VIAGDDALRQQNKSNLQSLIDSLGEQDSIKLLGSCKEIEEWYQRASIFAFCSSSEGFPNVVAEALSYGLPVVSYDCETGPAELIEDGKCGYLIELFDDITFLNRLNLLMKDDLLRESMRDSACLSISRYSSSKIAKLYLEEFFGKAQS
jgi:glycosyltransferase involved in cell wall biosynthesis